MTIKQIKDELSKRTKSEVLNLPLVRETDQEGDSTRWLSTWLTETVRVSMHEKTKSAIGTDRLALSYTKRENSRGKYHNYVIYAEPVPELTL